MHSALFFPLSAYSSQQPHRLYQNFFGEAGYDQIHRSALQGGHLCPGRPQAGLYFGRPGGAARGKAMRHHRAGTLPVFRSLGAPGRFCDPLELHQTNRPGHRIGRRNSWWMQSASVKTWPAVLTVLRHFSLRCIRYCFQHITFFKTPTGLCIWPAVSNFRVYTVTTTHNYILHYFFCNAAHSKHIFRIQIFLC